MLTTIGPLLTITWLVLVTIGRVKSMMHSLRPSFGLHSGNDIEGQTQPIAMDPAKWTAAV